ncbi:MAG: glycoside hydrolase [Chloroflexi bacterium]|nr:glycoside hydrolase [Chloroflexota bacterium]
MTLTSLSPSPTPKGEAPLYLAIVWHQHQPLYYKDPTTHLYKKPWVRVHATKDYLDMVSTVARYPKVHVTFNLTPNLMRQLDDFAAGAQDVYGAVSATNAATLTPADKRFMLQRFFDINPKILNRYPRYRQLSDARGQDLSDVALDAVAARWSEADWRDLQVYFNLGWTDLDFLGQAPLKSLVDKGQNFSESDKQILFNEQLCIIRQVIPEHKRLQDLGQIEVITTPYTHPILPLLVDTNAAKIAMPDADLPTRFSYPKDAVAQVEQAVAVYQEHFGHPPHGMWPAEGSVSQQVAGIFIRNGIRWIASDEGVLAHSIGLKEFIRDSRGTVQQADQLYHPYKIHDRPDEEGYILFRDIALSDKIGFTYSGTPGLQAAQDFMNRLHTIRDRLATDGKPGPYLVSVILDGENAWENYDNDGKDFLNALYLLLSEDHTIQTITPSAFLDLAPQQPMIQDLWAGSWISHDFSTWIGEDEENLAWDYLRWARELLAKYESGEKHASPEALQRARENIYAAEGSDWFWWYGSDQDSGNDQDFDQQFRAYLRQVYQDLGEPVAEFVDMPVMAQKAQAPSQNLAGLVTPAIDDSAGKQ